MKTTTPTTYEQQLQQLYKRIDQCESRKEAKHLIKEVDELYSMSARLHGR